MFGHYTFISKGYTKGLVKDKFYKCWMY